MNWFIFALGTVLLWGIGQIFIKKGLSTLSPLWNNIIATVLYFVIYIPIALLHGESIFFSPGTFFSILLGAALYIIYYYAIEKGQLSISGTIIAMYPVATILLSVFFLREELKVIQILMILLILIGGILLTHSGKKRGKVKISWITWAVMGALAIGTGDFLAKVIIDQNNATTYNLLFPFAYAINIGILSSIDKNGRVLPKKVSLKTLWPTIVGVICMNLGLISFNYALSIGKASLVSIVASSYVGLTILLAYLFLKESLNTKQCIAIILMLIGIIFVNF